MTSRLECLTLNIFMRLRGKRANRLTYRATSGTYLVRMALIFGEFVSLFWKSDKRPWAVNISIVCLLRFSCSLQAVSCAQEMSIQIATYEEVKDLPNHPEKLLIDVREPAEIAETGSIPTSINIPCEYDLQREWKVLSTFSQSIFLWSGSCATVAVRWALWSRVRDSLSRKEAQIGLEIDLLVPNGQSL